MRRRDIVLGSLGVGAGWTFGARTARAQAGAPGDDMTIGAANAPASLIEYASSTCPHCREFYETVWAPLKLNYIDTGKLRYTFREFPTPPPAVAVAGFQVARCGNATPAQYLTRVGALFDQQQAIFSARSMEEVRQKFITIGAQFGLNEQQVMACITEPAAVARIQRIEEGSRQFQVAGTPTLILNGHRVDDPSAVTYAGLSHLIDAAIAGH